MRYRLIEMIAFARSAYYGFADEMHKKGMPVGESSEEYIADYLLKNGVIVPPCKEGDELYRIITRNNGERFVSLFPAKVEPYGIYSINMFGVCYRLSFDEIGKTVFLTKEEAEQALEKLKGGSEE